MESYAYYNGVLGRRSDIKIPLSDRAIFFGDAVYDAALTVGGTIVWEDEHEERFLTNARALLLRADLDKSELKQILRETVKKAGFDMGFLYFQLSRDLEKRVHSAVGCEGANLLVTVEEFTPPDPEKLLSAITFPDERYGYCGIKTVNLLPSVFAATRADEKGCDEAIFIRDGVVTECSRSNIFILKSRILKTHPLTNRILPGIARKKVIDAAKRLGVRVVDTPFGRNELFDADEVLITSTTKLCLGVKSVDGVSVGGKNPSLRRKLYGELHKDIVKISNY